jgi:hypothetical protein
MASLVVVVLFGAAVATFAPFSDRARGGMQLSLMSSSDLAACRVGGTPTHPYGDRPPERFLRYRTRPIVIGCVTLASGRPFELVGFQLGTAESSELCIDHYDVESQVTWGCGSNRVASGEAIGSTSTARHAEKPDVVSGTVLNRVRRVAVRSELRKRLRRHAVSTVRVRGRELLEAIGIGKPFGRFLAEVPSNARAVTAEAFDRRRRSLGLVFFPGFRPPIGEGRACYGRPRVARMRLLDPPRRGERSRLRVVATYARGYVSTLEAAVVGSRNDKVHFARRPGLSADGRRVATLRLRFSERGTVGVDAIATGRPLSRRCGPDPAPRQSNMKTLVVRVR